MVPAVSHFIVVLQLYMVPEFSLQRAFYIISVLVAAYPLFRLHLNQLREPRQPRETAWLRSIFAIFTQAFNSENEHPDFPPEPDDLSEQLAKRLCGDLEHLYHLLGFSSEHPPSQFFPEPHTILCTTRVNCLFCPNEGHPPTLRRHRDPQQIQLLDKSFNWVKAQLYVAYCPKCQAEYYPDRITFLGNETHGRKQRLEYDAAYLRVSKHGIWMDRRIALAQENAILRFHSGWTNFAEWLSDVVDAKPRITARQSQRLYFEHFARRLIIAHELEDSFTVPAHSDAQTLAKTVREVVGENGGIIPGSMNHGCTRCTHLKRYAADLLAEGVVLDANESTVIDAPDPNSIRTAPTTASDEGIPPELLASAFPKQQERAAGSGRGYTRLASMDGKTINHRTCAVNTCDGPLVNFKNGRFCKTHLQMEEICGIIPCGRPVHSTGAVTCDDETHKEWHRKYLNRFSRLSFPGVQRVVRRQTEHGSQAASVPTLHSELPELNGVGGENVVHTFRARTTYCLQTVQWACGCPIGWGKCYQSESSSQVLKIIDRIWEHHPDFRPSFLAYDDACNLLRHIVTQDPQSPWIHITKLIVDAWHYIGHQATDILCRIWCNPAPANGSQPDLVLVQTDDNGVKHTTRAFNTETAEQLNAWLTGYEAQLRQMSDINFDFSVHVLLLLYKELVEKRVKKKNHQQYVGRLCSVT
ncbi:hypothetical protein R3P38DRAFT_3234901 [Favolaschia claudopus]|uniref:CxC5 like cysteine cluster associated with KDZ domain-containing protein n=1 Tax=Favolaschia claudopus TaxID=2862362 RepID=A0AAV9ZFY8_9AGAR